MRFPIRGWILLCVTVALSMGHLVRLWSPATGMFLIEPRWVFEESSAWSLREKNEQATDYSTHQQVDDYLKNLY